MSDSGNKAVFLSYASQDAEAVARGCEDPRPDQGVCVVLSRERSRWRIDSASGSRLSK